MTVIITPGQWTLDPAHSEASFSVRHAGISKVRGTFEDFSGSATFTEDFYNSQIEAVAKTDSVNTRNDDRDAHLRSEDFFASDKYPDLRFESVRIENFDGETFQLVGNLTIRDVTREVVFDVEFGGQNVDAFGVTRAGFEASTSISREQFGLTWNAALEAGGFLVSDTVKIHLNLSFVQGE